LDTAVGGIEDLAGFAIQVSRIPERRRFPIMERRRPGERFDEELVTKAELHLTEFFRTGSAAVSRTPAVRQQPGRFGLLP
jgi:hypothetical protein